MVANKVLVGFNPPEEDIREDLKAAEILEVIKQYGCSYPSEICGETDIGKETCYRKLRFMCKQGIIKRMSLDGKDNVPLWLEPRIKDLWAKGLKGDAIRRLAWHTVVKDEGKK